MTFGLSAAAIGGIAAGIGGVAGAIGSSSAAGKAAKAQTGIADLFGTGEADAQGRIMRQGANQNQNDGSIPQYNYSVDPNDPNFGSATKAFGMDQFNADPGYAFRMSEGMKALERSAAARGGLLSGSTLKGITRFGQDTAAGEYQNAFNRYQIERQARLNPLQSLMGGGQTSAGLLTGAAGQLGQGLGQAAVAQGAANASSYMSQSTALNNALQGMGNNFMMYNLMNRSNP